MELKWLEDFLALAEYGSFSKAAEARHVTQPAYSRRIRALEAWLGVDLVDRQHHVTTLTPVGEEFVTRARALITRIYLDRDHLRDLASARTQLVITTQQALAVSFLPGWMQTLENLTGDALIRVRTRDLHDGAEAFLSGAGDFLLCYACRDVFTVLEREDVENLQVGTDELVPVTATDNEGRPLHGIDDESPLRMLIHPPESFFGKLIQQQCLPQLPADAKVRNIYENALSEGLKAMVLQGNGVAWIPASIISAELVSNQLQIVPELARMPLQIRLYRLKQPRSEVAEKFWQYLQELYDQSVRIY